MSVHDQILEYLRVRGPSLPAHVAKDIKSNILIASAHLADLSARKKLLVSHLKVGGSPLYYLEGQEVQLERYLESNVDPKEYAALHKLKEAGVVREADLAVIERVALREVKDFAVPLHVVIDGNRQLFWRWHQFPKDELNAKITNMLAPPVAPASVPLDVKVEAKEIVPAAPTVTPITTPGDTPLGAPIATPMDTPPMVSTATPMDTLPTASSATQTDTLMAGSGVTLVATTTIVTPPPLVTPSATPRAIHTTLSTSQAASVLALKDAQKPLTKPIEEPAVSSKTSKIEQKEAKSQGEQPKPDESKDSHKKAKPVVLTPKGETFWPKVQHYCVSLQIAVEEYTIVRKNAEIDSIVGIPTIVGPVRHFCKIKKKSRVDEKDLAAAYVEAQLKRLPLLFFYTKDLTKKAQELLDQGAYENALVKKIES